MQLVWYQYIGAPSLSDMLQYHSGRLANPQQQRVPCVVSVPVTAALHQMCNAFSVEHGFWMQVWPSRQNLKLAW